MENQYVKVTFPTRRDVWVDGRVTGSTNVTFQVETGHHVFDLGEQKDYTPEKQELVVIDTMAEKPLIIEFQPLSVDSRQG